MSMLDVFKSLSWAQERCKLIDETKTEDELNEVIAQIKAEFFGPIEWVEEGSDHKFGANMGTPALIERMRNELIDFGLDPTIICELQVDKCNVYYKPKDLAGYLEKSNE
jgi:hypothetical protein